MAILGEIKKIFDKNDSSAFKSIVDKVYRVSAKTVPILFKAALKKVGLEDLADIGESIAEGSLKEFDNEINEYDNKKNSLSEIRRELSSYIKDKSNGKPFVFIVDELDRCRPDYAEIGRASGRERVLRLV